jgi:hypothetical protein
MILTAKRIQIKSKLIIIGISTYPAGTLQTIQRPSLEPQSWVLIWGQASRVASVPTHLTSS